MTDRWVWVFIAAMVVATYWLLVGTVRTLANGDRPPVTTSTSWYHGDGDRVEVTP